MRVLCLTAAAALAAIAGSAAAQTTVSDLVVVAPIDPEGPNRASQVVPYHDLDLRMRGAQEQLKWRVEMAAREVCRDLDRRAPATGTTLTGRSCEREAVQRAKPQVRAAIDRAFAEPAYAAMAGRNASAVVEPID